MSLVNSPFWIASAAATATGQSLRFEDGDSAYMTRTPASAGNRRTWTFSTWVKRGNITSNQGIFGAESSGDRLVLGFGYSGSDQIRFYCQSPSTDIYTNAVLRDPSAWYHIVWAVDTTQSTATDRIKIYVNGEQITSFASASYPAQNSDYSVNNTVGHYIGRWAGYAGEYLDGYLANACFIDGQQLTPTSFGEYNDTLWKPKSDADIQSLTFGTNGFYLPFKQTTTAEGFSTVTYTGNGGTHSIEGVGFEADLIWVKNRDVGGASYFHNIYDSVRGINSGGSAYLDSSSTAAETGAGSGYGVAGTSSNGFDLINSGTLSNESGKKYVAWCWDAGTGSSSSNTNGSITSTVKANTAKGFSIGTFTKGSGTETFGHGLSSAPELLILKRYNGTGSWFSYSSVTGATKWIRLNGTDAATTNSTFWNDTAPTSSVATISTAYNSGEQLVFYAWHSVAGYSSIGSYTGTGAAGNAVTGLGFKPAFVMVKRTDSIGNWVMFDNTRSPVNTADNAISADLSDREYTSADGVVGIDFDSDGFTLQDNHTTRNASGGSYMYLAFADTRDATFFGDTSGNDNNWTPSTINNTDVLPDSPVTNWCIMNPIDWAYYSSGTLSQGNLRWQTNTTSGNGNGNTSSIQTVSGKYYYEIEIESLTASGITYLYVSPVYGSYIWWVYGGTYEISGSTGTTSISLPSTGSILQIAIDCDAGNTWYGLNGTWYTTSGTPDPAAGTGAADVGNTNNAFRLLLNGRTGQTVNLNFGQDSSFGGRKTPQGNTDDNGVGDFYYAPPSGFLALCTQNLPTPTITAPDEHFNTVLYTGNGTTQSITGVNFQPDWTWLKSRSIAMSHGLFDAVRGAGKAVYSNLNYAEYDYGTTSSGELYQFNSDGFDLGSFGNYNANATTFTAWNWLAGNGTVSNTDGSITSTVSANQTAGFSVVSYTSNASGQDTVGHGLTSAPEMIITKSRDGSTFNWSVFHADVCDTTSKFLRLNTTDALTTYSTIWGAALPTSSVFGITSGGGVEASDACIAYCFHSVEGYSKIGSYRGNGSTDGVFVHCGFRPAFVMIKRSNNVEDWLIVDATRSTYNDAGHTLWPNLSDAENNYSSSLDLLSNGFKLRNSGGLRNGSGDTYIFIAFAEAPFKSANAR